MSFPLPVFSRTDLKRLAEIGEEMIDSAKFACETSCLPAEAQAELSDTHILVIDVGGTHTKVACRRVDSDGTIVWISLFDVLNDELKNAQELPGKLVAQMVQNLAQLISDHLSEFGLKVSDICGLGIVWSNRLESFPFCAEDNLSGVGGLVSGIEKGSSYRKGEWWNADLCDGDNLGQYFKESFLKLGFPLKACVLGNDTIFTAKALAGSDGGVVSSTGANNTLCAPSDLILVNAESGGSLAIPSEMLGVGDVLAGEEVKLEDLMTGLGMPPRLYHYLEYAAEQDPRIAQVIADRSFDGKDLTLLLNKDFDSFCKRHSIASIDQECQTYLYDLAAVFTVRGGELTGLMAYFSIYSLIQSKDSFKIALDSSQARFLDAVPSYFDAAQKGLDYLLPAGKVAELVLMHPEGNESEISVPLVGAAKAVNDFLD